VLGVGWAGGGAWWAAFPPPPQTPQPPIPNPQINDLYIVVENLKQ